MAWEISITSEGWRDIYNACRREDKEKLARAIVTDESCEPEWQDLLHRDYKVWDLRYTERQAELMELPHDVLADMAYDLIETNNTCDNGGFAFWIDREGYEKIYLD